MAPHAKPKAPKSGPTSAPSKPTKSAAPRPKSKATEQPGGSTGLSTALALKQKLLAAQKNLKKSKKSELKERENEQTRIREARAAAAASLARKRKGRLAEDESSQSKHKKQKQESDSEEEEEDDISDDDEEETSVMDLMRLQFEKQFGKVAGVANPLSNKASPAALKKTKKEAKSKKPSKKPTSDSSEDEEASRGRDEELANDDEWDIEIPQHGHAFDSMFHDFEKDDSEAEDQPSQEEESSDDEKPLVVRHTDVGKSAPKLETSKREKKLFMSSKAPASVSQRLAEEKAAASASLNAADDEEENEEDKILTQEDLKNDLELQRLLRESHILADAASKGKLSGYDISSAYDVEGRHGKIGGLNGNGSRGLFGEARLKTMEMRMDHLGMKKKKDRPLNMKVIQTQAAERKVERRRQIDEAREAGIILPKSVLLGEDSKKAKKRADRGLNFQLVGKHTKNGLVVSKRDISKVSSASKD